MIKMPQYLRDVVMGTDFTDLTVSRHHEEVYGTAQVEYITTELRDQDRNEDWSCAKDALELGCAEEFGVSNKRRWKVVGHDGRWVTFEAVW